MPPIAPTFHTWQQFICFPSAITSTVRMSYNSILSPAFLHFCWKGRLLLNLISSYCCSQSSLCACSLMIGMLSCKSIIRRNWRLSWTRWHKSVPLCSSPPRTTINPESNEASTKGNWMVERGSQTVPWSQFVAPTWQLALLLYFTQKKKEIQTSDP